MIFFYKIYEVCVKYKGAVAGAAIRTSAQAPQH
jgi:hypothetical protein